MGTYRKPYLKFEEAGRKSRINGNDCFYLPVGITRTQRAFWKLGWEQQDDDMNQERLG
jgi:hypothetical protein